MKSLEVNKKANSPLKMILSNVLIAFSLFTLPVYADDETEEDIAYRNMMTLEGVPEYVEDHRERLRQLRMQSQEEGLENLMLQPQPLEAYLFQREGQCSTCFQDVSVSKKVVKELKKKPPSKVGFDQNKIAPFDDKGTCSAMALDFLTRFLKQCSHLTKAEDFRDAIKGFSPYYIYSTTTDISRQSSYNTIKVDKALSQSQPDLMKHRKMQSLANYNGLTLTPAFSTIKISTIQNNPNNFKTTINNLPNGAYAVRALSPTTNHKMENYGHTMVLVKGANFSVYYDNRDGAVEITNDVGGYVRDKILAWGIPEVRLYNAKCSANGCFNLSTETSN